MAPVMSGPVKAILLIVVLTLGWYASSMSIVLMNRWAFGVRKGAHISPVVITILHMMLKTCLAVLACALTSRSAGSLITRLRERLLQQQLDKHIVLLHLLPIGAVTAVDVVLSNYSLKLADVAVYTVTKSTALLWSFLLSVLLRLLPFSPALGACVVLLLVGVALCTYRPGASADPLGVACAAVAAACAAARWVLTERYMSRPGVPRDVLALLALMGPFTVLSLIPPLLWELPGVIASTSTWQDSDYQVLALVAVCGGVLALFLVMFELLLVRLTSALSLNVIGHAKDAIVIILAVVIFNEQLSVANWSGVVLTLVAAVAYARVKEVTVKGQAQGQQHDPAHEAQEGEDEGLEEAEQGKGDQKTVQPEVMEDVAGSLAPSTPVRDLEAGRLSHLSSLVSASLRSITPSFGLARDRDSGPADGRGQGPISATRDGRRAGPWAPATQDGYANEDDDDVEIELSGMGLDAADIDTTAVGMGMSRPKTAVSNGARRSSAARTGASGPKQASGQRSGPGSSTAGKDPPRTPVSSVIASPTGSLGRHGPSRDQLHVASVDGDGELERATLLGREEQREPRREHRGVG